MTEDDDLSSTTFLRLLLVVFGTLSLVLVLPFFQPVLAGALLAYLVAPINNRLSRRLGATVGALVTILITVIVVLVPLLLILAVAVDQAVSLASGAEIPDLAAVETTVQELLGTDADLQRLLEPLSGAAETGLRGVLGGVIGIVGGIPAFVVGAVIFLFTFYYLLRDGDAFVAWLRTAAPLEPDVMDELIERTDDLLWAAVVGNVIVAGLQAILTVLGFVVLGFEDLVFWGIVTFVLSLLPLIGASIIWIPAVIYLVIVGNVPAAVGLLVYGFVIISGSDNFVRPIAMQRGAHLNSGLLVLGIFGGVAVFGFLGLFIGPVILGLSKAVVDLLVEIRGTSGEIR
ncbi:AI-2E family transporter [Natrinema ejinorense]|uniref:AI-2E family transporter n=1 Tax=Natrinema ejinorense TaxID=373386 RepID=A0A2A5QU57_9EURY|nr:AI-2E family transporter [Natrinema ejinorense]PCR90381.1 AI-2E family transporter [Natrinema ejinorense]